MTKDLRDGESDGSSDDDDFNFESEVGSRKFPVHDCCEFEDSESLKRLIFVRQDDSDDDSSSSSSSSSEDNDDGTASTSEAEQKLNPLHSHESLLPSKIIAKVPEEKSKSTNVVMNDASNQEVTESNIGKGTHNVSPNTEEQETNTSQKANETKSESETDDIKKKDIAKDSVERIPDNLEKKNDVENKDISKPISTVTPTNIPSLPIKIETSTKEQGRPAKKKRTKKKTPKEPTYYCPYDLNQRDADENTPLHVAIHFRKLECVRLLLEAGADMHRKCDGSAPIQLAVSIGAIPEHTDFAENCLSVLASYNADFALKDESLHTPLYLACMSNVPRCAQIILSDPNGLASLNVRSDRIGGRSLHACAKYCIPPRRVVGAAHAYRRVSGVRHPHQQVPGDDQALMTKVLLACPDIEVDAVNFHGQTPLHIAASRGNWATARLLLQAGANPLAVDRRNLTPGRIAAKRGIAVPNDLETHFYPNATDKSLPSAGSMEENKRDLIIDPDASTVLICHDLCSLHRSCPPIRRSSHASEPPPENVRRLEVLIGQETGILRGGEFQSCAWDIEPRRASIADVLKVHDYSYVERISQLCASIPDNPSAIASLDADTAVSRWSFEAAMRASGSVCEAVDKVMAGDHRNAFCAVRPPGHHAGPRGIVTCPNDPEGSHGFCLLNNVAIGAAYARSMYRNDGIKKVAIIDFDVHHGNGTEEIIRQLVPNVQSSSIRTPFAIGSLQTSRYKPWLDEEDMNDVFFASTHGFGPRELCFGNQPQSQGGWFYPASGESQITDAIKDPSSVTRQRLEDFLSTQTWTRMGSETQMNCCKIINVGLDLPNPYDVPGMQRVDIRDAYRKKILPHLVEFDPDMIFISAGFDGHKKDEMNFGYVGMIEDDYEWITENLIKVANTCCQGRVVSVLEGGYRIHGGIVSPFARSVASHVRALTEGGSSRELYNAEDGEWESKFERNIVLEREKRRQIRLEKIKAMEMERLRPRNGSVSNPIPPVPDEIKEKHAETQHEEPLPHPEAHTENNDFDAIMKEPLRDNFSNMSNISNVSNGIDSVFSHFGGATPSPFHAALELIDQQQQQNQPQQAHDQKQEEKTSEEALPSRKRRRNPVDYRELYEQMKKEGNLA